MSRISEAEHVVMEVLWQSEPQTADDIIDAVAGDQDWGPSTVRTLLNRLLKKGVVSAERVDRMYAYTPVLKREAYLREESDSFLGRFFDGELAPLVSHLSQSKKLNSSDIAELKRLIADMDEEG